MRAFYARNIHEACRTANQRAARECQFWRRLPATLGQSAGAIAQPLAAGEQAADHRMRLESLELVEGRQRRIGVVQVNHKTNDDLIVLDMVEERPPASFGIQRPPERMLDQPRRVQGRIDLPQLLDADAILLRL